MSHLDSPITAREVRYHQLDSLRGIAAMTVVLLHFRNLMIPEERVASFSPGHRFLLHLAYPLTTGRESVVLFFVLSGFVLMPRYISGNNQTYRIFVVRRMLRIYGPYVFALALSIAGAAIWHGHRGMDDWGKHIWSKPISFHLVIQYILMIGVYNWHEFNPAFWTLIEEIRISLIYPLLAYIVLRFPAKYSLLLAVILALFARETLRIWHQSAWIMTLEYIGMFLCGMVLAKNFTAIGQWYGSRKTSTRVWLASLALILFETAHIARHFSDWLMTFAAIALIVIALVSQRAGKFLSFSVNKYLGRISYSLYLVHIPVLFALTITLRPLVPPWVILPLYVSTAVALASVFYMLVEKPFTKFSRRATSGKALSQ